MLPRFHTTVAGVRLGRIDLVSGVAALPVVLSGLPAFRLIARAPAPVPGTAAASPTP